MNSRLVSELQERFGHHRFRVAVAPGRVNLIGEHTDYNEGLVLPIAIDRSVRVAFASNPYHEVRGYSVDYDEERSARLDDLAPPSNGPSWFDYVGGTAWVLRRDGLSVQGIDFALTGDLPKGAGLSSSAAVELVVARALYSVSGLPWDPRGAALAGQSVENDYLGLESGIMDQMVSALAAEGSALLLDCRDLSYRAIPIPPALSVVVIDTGTPRSVVSSAYNDRKARCDKAVGTIRERYPETRALRDVSVGELGECAAAMDDETYRRALHVITENQRVIQMARALASVDLPLIAKLMSASHDSLRHLYEVSTDALDSAVALAQDHPACCGARMTGAGFGGSVVALVRRAEVDPFMADIGESLPAGAAVFSCEASGGTRLLD